MIGRTPAALRGGCLHRLREIQTSCPARPSAKRGGPCRDVLVVSREFGTGTAWDIERESRTKTALVRFVVIRQIVRLIHSRSS